MKTKKIFLVVLALALCPATARGQGAFSFYGALSHRHAAPRTEVFRVKALEWRDSPHFLVNVLVLENSRGETRRLYFDFVGIRLHYLEGARRMGLLAMIYAGSVRHLRVTYDPACALAITAFPAGEFGTLPRARPQTNNFPMEDSSNVSQRFALTRAAR